jgi:tRNA-splicing ligase RtcB
MLEEGGSMDKIEIRPVGDATGIIPVEGRSPITVIATDKIRDLLEQGCLQQAINSRLSPGVTKVVINPDAHLGFGSPIGCVMVSPDHVYPGPVGVDVKCSMSLLQMDLGDDAINPRETRRALIDAILDRIPTGPGRGMRNVPKGRKIGEELGFKVVSEGASESVLYALGIPVEWAQRCEDSSHKGNDELDAHAASEDLRERLQEVMLSADGSKWFDDKIHQLGSYGGGNHFGECEAVSVVKADVARAFGLEDGKVAFLSHCGSRGFGHNLAMNQFRILAKFFEKWDIPLPGGDKELVYAPLGTPEASLYLRDMALAANFATVNHMLINQLVLEAFRSVFPGIAGRLVYFISHNIVRREIVDGQAQLVHRKGATRAFPGGHHALKGTPFESTGHPILLPGNPINGSVVMHALPGAVKSCYSVNHGAGRSMSRSEANKTLNQQVVDEQFSRRDVLTNCRAYPRDEAPASYKDFDEVVKSVELSGLAAVVARLRARFVLKDGGKGDD